ncbi:MAG TPA: hypothetical protein VGD33_07610, partial [Chitinophagaceae bacterium]
MKKKSKQPVSNPKKEGVTAEILSTGENTRKKNGKTNHKALEKEYTFSEELDNRELLRILSEVRNGNFSVRLPIDKLGISGKICDILNDIISLNETFVEQLTQARNTIGKQGHLNHRVELPRTARGSWASGVDSINSLISDLVHPT